MNIAFEEFKTLIFENSVYSNSNKVLEKSLPKVTKNDVTGYYNRILDPQNIVISISGNVNSQKMIQSFGSIFNKKQGTKFSYSNHSVTKLNSPKTVTKKIKDLETAWLFMGWQVSGVQDKKDFVTLKVINTLLGSGLSSRLYRNLRESDGLAYQLGSSYSPRMLG